jgi:uncharacterized protein (TIGR03083 family)
MAKRFAALAGSAPDPGREVKATPGWSINDVLGHVAMEPSRYNELARGGGTWPARATDMAAFNAERIRALPTRDPPALAAKLVADTEGLLSTIDGFGNRQPMMNFDGNQQVRADRALGTLLSEFVIHGHDIARTVGSKWPIDRTLVPLILDGLNDMMPGWTNPERAANHTATYELRLRGLGNKYVYSFDNGCLTIDPADAVGPDVCISAEPVTWLLLSYGRINKWGAALTGRVLVWGRKPWLATAFAQRFHSP